MRQQLIKVINKDGSTHFERTRYLTLVNITPDHYVFKDIKGNIIEPTELELKLFNESQGGAPISNGWITFIGILTLINLIFQLILITNILK